MRQINATARNLAALIVLAALAGAVFWLIARPPGPEEAQPAVQATGRPTPAAAAAQTTQTPHPTPTASAAPQPTRTPFTPEVVVGKGSLITAPSPTPTAGPGPLAAYQISEPTYVPLAANDQILGYLGFSSDGSQLVTYQVSEDSGRPATLSSFAVSGTLRGQSLGSQVLALDAAKLQPAGRHPSIDPIRLLGQTDHIIYREQITENRFELNLTDLAGQNPGFIGPITSPNYAISDDGLIAYVNRGQVMISNPFRNNQLLAQLAVTNYGIDTTHDSFGLALSPGGEHVAIYGEGASLQIVDVATGQPTQIRRGEGPQVVAEAVWSPDGSRLAYNVSRTLEAGFPGAIKSSLFFVDPNGENHQLVVYRNQENGDPATLVFITWMPDSQLIAMKSVPFMCQICEEAIVLISRDGQHFREIVRSETSLRLLGWQPGTQSLAYRCTPPSNDVYNTLCIVNLSK